MSEESRMANGPEVTIPAGIDGRDNQAASEQEMMNSESNSMNDTTTTTGQQQQSAWTASSQTQEQTQNQSATVHNTLYRHPSEKMIGGVCGGLADYFGWDPALVRILWLVATIATGGGGLLAYLVLWGLLPVGTVKSGVQRPPAFELNERNIGRMAVVLIGLGGLWLLTNLGILPGILRLFWWVLGVFFWPALLIGIGYLLLRGTGNTDLSFDLNDLKSRLRGRMSGVKMPKGSGVKSSFNQMRDSFPLQRSTSDRLFLGVCGGLGKRLGIDPNLIRLLWAAFSIMSIGMGVFLYVALGLLLPEEKPTGLRPYDHVQDVEVIEGTTPRVV